MTLTKITISILSMFSAVAVPASGTPNVIFLMADDLGYGSVGCYGAPPHLVKTPHIDRLASEGIRFTDASTPSSVCTPTRYGLLTGRYCWRTRLKSGVLDGFDPPLIDDHQDTIARLLKRSGYRTHCIGKWHLGLRWTDKNGTHVPDRDPAGGFRSAMNLLFFDHGQSR